MVLCQIALSTYAKTEYPVNIAGRVTFRILGIQYIYTGNAGASATHEIIQLRSSRFQTVHSTKPNALLFSNLGGDHSTIPNSEPMEIIGEMYGSLDLEIVNLAGNAPTNFGGCVLTMDIVARE